MNTPNPFEKIISELMDTMSSQLQLLERETQDDLTRFRESREVAYKIVCELREAVRSNPFRNLEQEIKLFRHIKPSFLRQYIYFQKLHELKFNEPALQEEKKKYVESILVKLDAFRSQHRIFYEYCISSETHFDTHYFTRQSKFQCPDYDRNFSTGYDTLYATLLANEDVKKYLFVQLQAPVKSDPHTSLTWTASKAALIELIYALKATEVFNEGKADIKQITTSLENLFHISLGNYYRVYQDIRLRKSGQTNFLDQLKEKFTKRIEEQD